MSQLAQTRPQPMRLRIPLWLVAAVLVAGAAIVLVATLTSDDEGTQAPKAAVADTSAGIRYDGGPEEGTRGVTMTPSAALPEVAPPASSIAAGSGAAYEELRQANPNVRYDGGPEEGSSDLHMSTRGAATTPGVRYAGGPEEGSALAR